MCFSGRPLSVHLNHRQTYCNACKRYECTDRMYTIMQMPHQYIEITLWLSDMHESRLTVLINQGATRPRAAAHKISAQTVSRQSLCDRLSSGSCECARVVRPTAGSFICCPYLLVWQLSRSLLCQKFKSRSTYTVHCYRTGTYARVWLTFLCAVALEQKGSRQCYVLRDIKCTCAVICTCNLKSLFELTLIFQRSCDAIGLHT